MGENRLIKIENNQLAKIGNAIAITNKLIAPNERKTITDLFCKNPIFFFKTISWYYGLSHPLINKFKEKWNFHYLSRNENILWSIEFIEKFENKWLWDYGLSYNKSLPWSPELIDRYLDKWDWYGILRNHSLAKNEWFKKKYSAQIETVYVPKILQPKIMTDEEIEELINSLLWDRTILSNCRELPWSESLIEKYIDIWDWKTLSDNNFLPWSEKFIDKFIEKWDWANLSGNTSISWSEKIIEKYKYRWDWEYLFINNSIHWNISLFNRYKGLFDLNIKCNDFFWNNYFKHHVDDFLVEYVLEMNS